MRVYISLNGSDEEQAGNLLREAARRIEQGETFLEMMGQDGIKYGEVIVTNSGFSPRRFTPQPFREALLQ